MVLLLNVYSEAAIMNFTMILYYMIFSRYSEMIVCEVKFVNEVQSLIQTSLPHHSE